MQTFQYAYILHMHAMSSSHITTVAMLWRCGMKLFSRRIHTGNARVCVCVCAFFFLLFYTSAVADISMPFSHSSYAMKCLETRGEEQMHTNTIRNNNHNMHRTNELRNKEDRKKEKNSFYIAQCVVWAPFQT